MSDFFWGIEERSALVGFAGNPLDRLSERREDADYVARLREDHASRIVLVLREAIVLARSGDAHEALFSFEDARAIGAFSETALLGRTAAGAVFAVLLDERSCSLQSDGLTFAGRDDLCLVDLRAIATQGLLSRATTGVLAQAKSLMFWHARHRFCSVCGAPTNLAAAGWRRECPACAAAHFPRTDPVVIMLAVTDRECLLGRQSRFAKGMYSALAGFLEPGETVEDAVRREIREETGVAVDSVSYVASQPWPFPASLMIGCLARARSREIILDGAELEDARWLDRAQARSMLAGNHPEGLVAPSPIAIAHQLVKAWLDSG
ncbi:MAG TPA: NAD(+) diphosphatase [Beijerinckiaceae bacterium]|nr:NAD(+) diphosphatase [Beijerinckiaceae bacterium]